MDDLISRQAAIDALRYAQHRFTVADEAGGMGTVKWSEDVIYFAAAERVLAELPPAQPDENDQEFIKLTVRNSNGRPYYSIIYLEYDKNGVGHDFEGYSSYSLDVISDYLKKYFMPSAQPRPKTGHWIYDGDQIICNRCFKAFGFISLKLTSNYCPNCGAKMIEPQESEDKE